MSKNTSLEIGLSGEGRTLFDLVDNGKSASIGHGISIRYYGSLAGDSVDLAPTHNFVITIALPLVTEVAAILIADYILSKLRGKVKHITISRTKVQLEKGEIVQIINEEIEKSTA